MEKLKIRDQITQDGRSEHREAANGKRDFAPAQLFHKPIAIGVSAIEGRDFRAGRSAPEEPGNLLGDPGGFARRVRGLKQNNARPFGVAGVERGLLAKGAVVPADEDACGAQNAPCRAVIPEEEQFRAARKGLTEQLERARRGAAETINGLVVVANGGEVRGPDGQPFQDFDLGVVGILKFIYQDKKIPGALAVERIGLRVPKRKRLAEQAAKARAARRL